MKRLTAILVLFCMSASTLAQTASHDLKATLLTSCTTCKSDSDIRLIAYLENESPEPVLVYGLLGWGELGGFVLHIEDAAGKTVEPQALDDDMIVPSTLDDASYYVTLQPDHGLGKRRNQLVKELFPHPGKYTVWVSYQSPVPSRVALPKSGFFSRELGKLSSDKITITVQ